MLVTFCLYGKRTEMALESYILGAKCGNAKSNHPKKTKLLCIHVNIVMSIYFVITTIIMLLGLIINIKLPFLWDWKDMLDEARSHPKTS